MVSLFYDSLSEQNDDRKCFWFNKPLDFFQKELRKPNEETFYRISYSTVPGVNRTASKTNKTIFILLSQSVCTRISLINNVKQTKNEIGLNNKINSFVL